MDQPGRADSRQVGQLELTPSSRLNGDDHPFVEARDRSSNQLMWLTEDALAVYIDAVERATTQQNPRLPGPTLREELGPQRKPPADALKLSETLVSLMAAAHAADRAHGALSASTVHIQPAAGSGLTDRQVILAKPVVGTARSVDRAKTAARQKADVEALGSVLYELLCGHKPSSSGAADRLHHRSATPWPVADLVHACLDGDHFVNAVEVRQELTLAMGSTTGRRRLRTRSASLSSEIPATPGMAFGGDLRNSGLGRLSQASRRWQLGAIVGVAFLIPVALVLVLSQVLDRSSTNDDPTTIASAPVAATVTPAPTEVPAPAPTAAATVNASPTEIPTPEPTAIVPIELTIAGVIPWDPQGDFWENDPNAAAAIDGDLNTGWSTEVYRTDGFGEIKDGVGLWIVLDQPARIHNVSVGSATPDWPGEIHRYETASDEDLSLDERLAALSQTPGGDLGSAAASFVFGPLVPEVAANQKTTPLGDVTEPADPSPEATATEPAAAEPTALDVAWVEVDLLSPTADPDHHLLIWIRDTGPSAGAFGATIEELTVTGVLVAP